MASGQTIVIERDDDGYYAHVPSLEGCQSQGDTMEEVTRNIQEAIEVYLEAAGENEPPNASDARPPSEWTNGSFHLATEPARLDFDFIESALRQSYWAADRPRDVIEAAFRNSLPFGLYDRSAGGRQVGFARVITDKVNFSWIADVWLEPALRGRGVGTWMMRCILEHPDVINTRQTLATRDAHDFYEKLGFVRREVLRRYPGVAEPPGF